MPEKTVTVCELRRAIVMPVKLQTIVQNMCHNWWISESDYDA